MAEYRKHVGDLSGKFRSVGWLLILVIAVFGVLLLLKQYNLF